MNFDLSLEQTVFQNALRKQLAVGNDSHALGARYEQNYQPREDRWFELIDSGIPLILLPDEHGGLDMGMLTLALACEEMAHAALRTPMPYHCLVIACLAEFGSAEQKRRWLDALSSGKKTATLAVAESGNRWWSDQWSDLSAADEGRKTAVPFAKDSDLILLLHKNGMAILEMEDVSVEPLPSLDRSRPSYEIYFKTQQLDPLPQAESGVQKLLDALLIVHAADAFGAAKRCLDMAVEYAKTREQFGQPIGSFQALKHQLANMALDIEPCRALYWYAAHSWDAVPADRERMALIANAHICTMANSVARAAVEAHGGIGYTWEYPLHCWLKRILFDFSFMGTPQSIRQRRTDRPDWDSSYEL